MSKAKTSKTDQQALPNASPRAIAPAPLAPNPTKPKGWTLEAPPHAPGQTHDQFMAQGAADGVVGNARSLVAFGHGTFGELSLTDCAKALKQTAQGINDGDLSAAVTMLASQAVALNAMFGELARRAALNMGEHLGATETYMRLALKAQGQTRATLETLANIKNPPVVFARQANINNGGQQQVNNAPLNSAPLAPSVTSTRTGAHRRETASWPNELLEQGSHVSTQLDPRAAPATGSAHSQLEPVGTLNRPQKP